MDLNLQNREKNASVEFTHIPAKMILSKTLLHLWKHQQYSILFDVKNMTLHFVDLKYQISKFITATKREQNFIKILDISLVDSNETFLFKVFNFFL